MVLSADVVAWYPMAVEFVPPAELIAPNAVAVLPVLLEATPNATELVPW